MSLSQTCPTQFIWLIGYQYFIDYLLCSKYCDGFKEKKKCVRTPGILQLWWNIYALISMITSNTTKMRVTKTKLYTKI